MDGPKIKNMEEFAALSGISRPTVSKYFNDPESVRPSTRQRIEEALERHDFRPNIYAINQNRRLTKQIGIVVPYLADPFFTEMARSIELRCIAAGYWPHLFSSHGDPEHEKVVLEGIRSMRPAGVLLAPLGRRSDHDYIRKFCDDVPTVLFDSNIEDVGETFVGSNNFQSLPMIVDYLCRTGGPPCFFEMAPINPNANKRRKAYIQAMETLGHEPNVIRVPGESWDFEAIGYAGGLQAIEDRRFRHDVVLCSNDRLAIGLLAAAFEKGLRVGRGTGSALRIAGHDDHPFARFTCPKLTTVAQDYAAISNRSAELMFQLIDSGERASAREEILFEGKLIMRESA